MSTNFKDPLKSQVLNDAYVSKNTDDTKTGKLTLDKASEGTTVISVQKSINETFDTVGTSEGDVNAKVYATNNVISDGDNHKQAIEKFDVAIQQNSDDVTNINISIGEPNGICPLDINGRVSSDNLPNGVKTLVGIWDANTNTPTLADSVAATFDSAISGVTGNVELSADETGLIGNSILLTGDGVTDLDTLVSDWNTANALNTVTLDSANGADIPDDLEVMQLSGGTETGKEGYTYDVTVAGTQDLGSGSITFDINDQVVLNTFGIWQKRDFTDAVTSVFGRTGAVSAQSGDYTASQITEETTKKFTIKNNTNAVVDPTINDDVDLEYQVGSQWFNSATGVNFICQDNTDGAAIWIVATGSGGGGLGDVDTMYIDSFDGKVIGDYTSTGGVTLTETLSELIKGDKTAKIVHDAVTPETFKDIIDVNPKFRNKNIQFDLDIRSNATSGNVTIDFYDETNATAIGITESVEPFNGTGSEKRRFWFDMPETCESFSYTITALAESGAITFIDDISIRKNFTTSVQTITDELLKENEFSAVIPSTDGSASNQPVNFVQSVTWAGGLATINFVSGFFNGVTPNVFAISGPTGTAVTIELESVSPTSATLSPRNAAGTAFANEFILFAQRGVGDYNANLIRRVETKDTFSEIVVEQDRDISEINEFSARVNGSAGASASVISSNAEFIDSITFNGTGNYTVNLVPNIFSVIPSVVVTVIDGNTNSEIHIDAIPTTSGFIVETSRASGVVNLDFMLNVSRQGSDVYNKTLTRIKTNPNQKIKIPSSEMRLEGASTRGTGAETFTVKFDSLVKSIGGDLLLDNSNGTIITCKKDGLLSIACGFNKAGAGTFWATKNQVVNTTTPIANEVITSHGASTSGDKNLSATVPVKVGDKIRISGDGVPTAAASNHIELYFQEQEIQVGVSNILPKFSEADACIDVYGAGGYGSIANKIPRLTTIEINNPNGKISYTDTASDGNAFEILEDGTYSFSAFIRNGGVSASSIGFSLNSADLTSQIWARPEAEVLSQDTSVASSGFGANTSFQRELSKGDIVRFHTDGVSYERSRVIVSQVGKPNITAVDVTPFADLPLLDINSVSLLSNGGEAITANTENVVFNGSGNGWNSSTYEYTTQKTDSILTLSGSIYANANIKRINLYKNSTMFKALGNISDGNFGRGPFNINLIGNKDYVKGDVFSLRMEDAITLVASSTWHHLNIIEQSQSNQIVTEQDSNLSDWVDVGETVITATTTNPTKGTRTVDRMLCKRTGEGIDFKIEFTQTTAGTAGSGDYIFNLQKCLNALGATSFNMDLITPFTTVVGTGSGVKAATNGYGNAFVADGTSATGLGVVYDSTKIRVGIVSASTQGMVGNTLYALSQVALSYFIEGSIPVQGWSSEAKTLVAISAQKTAYIKDVKPSGTNGGTFTSGAWQTRDLNDLSGDTDFVSLNANQFTLSRGTYKILASAPAEYVQKHRIKLRDITNSLDAAFGTSETVQNNTASGTTTRSFLKTTVEINTPITFELQHRCSVTFATFGFGVAVAFGDDEFYSEIEIIKVK